MTETVEEGGAALAHGQEKARFMQGLRRENREGRAVETPQLPL